MTAHWMAFSAIAAVGLVVCLVFIFMEDW